ncbi:hypothetical protein B0T20DRAFT_391340 [Sordaria brevicollis]|uniref:Uncharacterized protein n=1 Tax=Sordaria brevicollis TaxID=83679 RepID=A0AAE0PH67_SORBR|nr:hypothetical protein B0T20DRAFT_391340 [Sordaria brevicollis]
MFMVVKVKQAGPSKSTRTTNLRLRLSFEPGAKRVKATVDSMTMESVPEVDKEEQEDEGPVSRKRKRLSMSRVFIDDHRVNPAVHGHRGVRDYSWKDSAGRMEEDGIECTISVEADG